MIWLLATLIDTDSLPKPKADASNFTDIFNIVLATVGAIAFFMIILSGFRYAASQGEPEKIASARRTIAYSIVGLVVMAFAATIVNFVVKRT